MASIWNKTLFYLGLVDEDENGNEAGESEVGEVRAIEPPPSQFSQPSEAPGASATSAVRPPGAVEGRRVEPPASTRRPVSADPSHAEAGLYVHPSDAGTPTSEMPA